MVVSELFVLLPSSLTIDTCMVFANLKTTIVPVEVEEHAAVTAATNVVGGGSV